MELIVKLFSDVDEDGRGKGGMNVLRLVSKRLMRMVESCATRLVNTKGDGPESFPLALRRCRRIGHIRCNSYDLKSLEGCPDGIKSLYIGDGESLHSLEPLRGCNQLESLEIWQSCQISDLSPLNACTRLKKLTLPYSQVTDISALASMSLLEEIELHKFEVQSSIKDLSPLSQCKRLKTLNIGGNREIEDISPLAQCSQLEKFLMWGLTKITDLKPLSSWTKLKELTIRSVPVQDLTPLSVLQNIEWLDCRFIPLTTSLLPLARCIKLKRIMIYCDRDAKYLDLLKERRPDINF